MRRIGFAVAVTLLFAGITAGAVFATASRVDSALAEHVGLQVYVDQVHYDDGHAIVKFTNAEGFVVFADAGTVCPQTPEKAALLIGGQASEWSMLGSRPVEGLKFESANSTTLTVRSGRLDHPNGQAFQGASVATKEATFWCLGRKR